MWVAMFPVPLFLYFMEQYLQTAYLHTIPVYHFVESLLFLFKDNDDELEVIPIPFPQLPLSHYDLQLWNTKKIKELYESKFLTELTTQKSVQLVPYRGKLKIPENLRISHLLVKSTNQ